MGKENRILRWKSSGHDEEHIGVLYMSGTKGAGKPGLIEAPQ